MATSICLEALFESVATAQGILAMLRERRKVVGHPSAASPVGGEGLPAAFEATAVVATAAVPKTHRPDIGGGGPGDGAELRAVAGGGGVKTVENGGQGSAVEQQTGGIPCLPGTISLL